MSDPRACHAVGAATVSVVIPAYNAAAWVAEAIQSALDQTYPAGQVIVVDDGSTDGTWDIASRFPHPVRALQKPNGGPASARNCGIAAASGTWIALLDADDRWAPGKLEKQLALAEPGVALVHTLDDGDTRDLPDTLTFDDLWQANLITNSSVLVRRDAVLALGGFNEDPKLKSVEDYHLWLRLAFSGARIISCKERLTFYRRGIGLSSNTAKFLEASLHNIDDLSDRLNLPSDMVRSRKLRIMDQFGRAFLYERQIAAARTILVQTFAAEPNLGRAASLGAAYLPRSVLDLRRGMLRRRRAPPPFATTYKGPDATLPAPLIPPEASPYLLAIIDTEEEFDWNVRPPVGAHIRNLREQVHAQKIFERFGLVPTYAIDYPVASQREGHRPLLEFLQDGRCEIGAHLHPWVTPPVEEELNPRNSFPGNLPRELERAKLIRLTETIEANFGCKPRLYRAGRYGLGPHTFETLAELGYEIDCSMLPFVDLSEKGGPDYTRCAAAPSWVGPDGRLLEIPVTTGVIGRLAKGNRDLYRLALSAPAERMHLPGLLARLGLLNRIRLTPEGCSLAEAMRLTDAMLQGGQRVFVLSYHSSSLRIGGTSYVRNAADVARFLAWIEGFLEFFFRKHSGRAATPSHILGLAQGFVANAPTHPPHPGALTSPPAYSPRVARAPSGSI